MSKTTKPKLKLTGVDGNAYAILGECKKAARKSKWPKEQLDAFMQEAMSGNYDHLLMTVCKYFDVS